MNTLHTTLTALEAQLESQKADCIEYETNVYDKQFDTLREKVSNFFVSIGIAKKIIFSGTNIRIMINENSSYSTAKIELYYELPWRLEKENRTGYVELSWYGSRCKSTESEDLEYLKCLGEIATLLPTIEAEWHKWYEDYKEYDSAKRVYYSAIDTTNRAIYDTKNLIGKAEIEQYKKVGFKCELKPKIECKRDWDVERGTFGDYKLYEEPASIRLEHGYGKWDYTYIDSFEIVKELKRSKMLVRIKPTNYTTEMEYELTPKFFEPFIQDVYNWQTSGAEEKSLNTYKFFDNQATKQVAEIAE